MTGRIEGMDHLSEGFDLLRKYGLYREPQKMNREPLDRTLHELDLGDYIHSPEIVAAWQALNEAKRLIGFKNTIEGTHVLLSDYFVGLAVKLLLPMWDKKLMDAACEQIKRISAKANHRRQRHEAVLIPWEPVCCAEDPLKTAMNNKLLQALERGGQSKAAQEIVQALSQMEKVFLTRYAGPDANEMAADIYSVLTGGGKRLRPILFLLCAGFGKPVEEEAQAHMMAAIELIHCASLVHDDIVDHSSLRHGKPTINARKGDGYAARCGFMMVSGVLELLRDTEDYAPASLFAGIPMEMCLGELRQIDVEFRPDLQTEEDYYRRIERKTAKLIEGACTAGGIASQAGEQIVEALSKFGHALGILFQLRDDLLDYRQWTDEGKPVLQDIERGIYSLPLLYALEQTEQSSCEGARLRQLLAQPVKSPEDIRYLLELAEHSGGIDYAAKAIELEAARAYAALDELPPGWQRNALVCLLDALSGDVLEYCSLNSIVEGKVI